jgi:hypothetical protein
LQNDPINLQSAFFNLPLLARQATAGVSPGLMINNRYDIYLQAILGHLPLVADTPWFH